MKLKTVSILFLLISLVGLGFAKAQTKYVLKVNGLTCPFCAYGLEKKLKKVKGIESVSIDLEKDQATVLVKEGSVVEEEALRKAVKKAGFKLASLERVESETTSSQPPLTDEGHQEAPR